MYTILNPLMQPIGSLSLRGTNSGTSFWDDIISQQIADDGTNDDPTTNLSMTANSLDSQANHKLWDHQLTLSFDYDELGSQIDTGFYILYFDDDVNKYYAMYVRQVEKHTALMYATATCSNAAIFDLSGIVIPAKSFTDATLSTIVDYIFKYIPYSVSYSKLGTQIDYNIDGETTAQAIIQDLQVKFDVEIDSYVTLDSSGHINNRTIYIGHLGENNGALLRYGSNSNGYESMTRTMINDNLYTKLRVIGVESQETDANGNIINPEYGHIESVNNGLDYILDDEANKKYNPIGASYNPPTYREIKLTNTILKEPVALLDWLKSQMLLFNHPRYNYTVTALHDFVASLGDTISLQDTKAIPQIFISSRVIQQTKSFASPENNTTVFGEFTALNSTSNSNSDEILNIKKSIEQNTTNVNIAINTSKNASQKADDAKQVAIKAQESADGKGTVLTLKSKDDLPASAVNGTQAWVETASGTYHYVFIDGDWAEDISPTMQKDITDKVTASLTEAKGYSDKLVADNNNQINNTINEVSQEKIDLALKDADFNNKAQAMADKALSDAKANTATVAQETLNSANQNIADAKKSLSDSINKEVTDRAKAVTALDTKAKGYADTAKSDAISASTTALNTAKTDLTNSIASEASARNAAVAAANSQAQTYANQAKADAMSAASSADSVIRTAISSSANSLSATITQNKSSSDSGIYTAQTTAQAAVDGLKFKVSQTDYDQKTGDLSTKINDVKQTADSSAQTIADIKIADGKQDARMSEIENTASGLKSTVSDLQTTQGKQTGDISTLQQRADGFDATVTKVNNLSIGGRNLYITATQVQGYVNGANGTITGPNGINKEMASDYIAVLPNTEYTFQAWGSLLSGQNYWAGIGQYDANKVFLNRKPGVYNAQTVTSDTANDYEKTTFTTDANTYYVRVSSRTFSNYNLKFEQGNLPTDWSPAPEDVDSSTAKAQLTADQATTTINAYKTSNDGRVASAESKITQNANAITQKVSQTDYDKKTGDLTTKVNTAQSTADSATSTIGSYKQTNDARVASAESKITANANAITQKVSQTDYNQKTGELSGSISTLKQRADGFDTTVTEFNNLAIGGRNYVLNSSGLNASASTRPTLIGATSSTSGSTLSYGADGITLTNATSNTDSEWYYQIASSWQDITKTPLSDGNYMISVDVMGTAEQAILRYGQTSSQNSNLFQAFAINNTTWTRISMPLVFAPNTTTFYIRINGGANNAISGTSIFTGTETIKFRNIKIESGNKATDWSPAPEDTDNKISTVSQKVDGITSIVSDPTTGLTKRVQTAEGTLSQVTGMDIPNLQKATFWQPYSSLNFNDYTKQGSFFFGTTSAKTNGPTTSNSWTYLIVEQGTADTSRIKQTAWYDGVNGVKITYVRTLNSGTWSPWYANDNDSVTTISQTNSSITREIADRKTGDSNTLQSSKDFTTSTITSAVNGVNSTITQTSDSLIAKINTKTDQQTVLSLLKSNWSIGIKDNQSALTSGLFGDINGMTLNGKTVTINANTTNITGTAWIKTAMIGNGQIGTAQIGDAAIGNAQISAIDAAKITSGLINTQRLNVGEVFAQGINTTNATIGKTLTIGSGGTITWSLNGSVQNFSTNPYWVYGRTDGGKGAYVFDASQSGTANINTNGSFDFTGTISSPSSTYNGKTVYAYPVDGAGLWGTGGSYQSSLYSQSRYGIDGVILKTYKDSSMSSGYANWAKVSSYSISMGTDISQPGIVIESDGDITAQGVIRLVQNWQSGAVGNNASLQFTGTNFWLNTAGNSYINPQGYVRLASSGGNGSVTYVNDTYGIETSKGIKTGSLYTQGGTAVYTTDGSTIYFLNGKAGGRNNIAVKSVSQSSLVSQKTNIGNVDTGYALNEVLKADVRSYSFIDDEDKQTHVSPMIDDVDNKMYIPKDWLDSEHEGVDTYSVIGYLIQAVKELNKKIEQLEQA